MLFQGGPCDNSANNAHIIAAVFAGFNLLLLTFLTNRRIRKDKNDDARWTRNEAQHQMVRRELRYGPSADVEDNEHQP